jgi:hypothetical protein
MARQGKRASASIIRAAESLRRIIDELKRQLVVGPTLSRESSGMKKLSNRKAATPPVPKAKRRD